METKNKGKKESEQKEKIERRKKGRTNRQKIVKKKATQFGGKVKFCRGCYNEWKFVNESRRF